MKQIIHANAVNLARRLSAQNENDLLQESYYDKDHMMKEKTYTKSTCMDIAAHLQHLKNLPPQCMQYSEIVEDLKARDKDTSHPTQWLS